MTFLELCAELARQTAATNGAPSTVVGQTSRKGQVVSWIRTAWLLIQNSNPYWDWLRAEFEAPLTPGVAAYTAEDLGVVRFAQWVGDTDRQLAFTLYDPALGRQDEQHIRQAPYDAWRRRFDFGVPLVRRPTYWAIAPRGLLKFGDTPDKAYRVRGEYRMTPQILAADNDVPEMPERFHPLIWMRAALLMAESDEAPQSFQFNQIEYNSLLRDLQRDCLPQFDVRGSGPMA